MNSETKWLIALGLLKGVGLKGVKSIVGAVGSAEEVFGIDPNELVEKEEKIGFGFVEAMKGKEDAIKRAEQEMEFIDKYNIEAVNFTESQYPERLRHCVDAPLVLFKKGNTNLNASKVISVVGTRQPTRFGEDMCEEIVGDLARNYPDLLIVSGLAYGIDVCSHRVALENKMPTVGVLGHGLHTIYPAQHREIAKQMVEEGGALVTEYNSGIFPDGRNFIARNRIIAGMSDATLVVESGMKGGSLITARFARSDYNRDVFAIPGSPKDEKAKGCNALIRENIAALVENAEDIANALSWDVEKKIKSEPVQTKMFVDFNNEEEQMIYEAIEARGSNGEMMKNDIANETGIPVSKVATAIFMMETEGLISVSGNTCRIKRRR